MTGLIQSKDRTFSSKFWISHYSVPKNITKWRKIQNSRRYIFWLDQPILKTFSVLRSSWHVFSDTVIRYPIILKNEFGAKCDVIFPPKMQKPENLKTWNFWNAKFCSVVKFQIDHLKMKNINGHRHLCCHICQPLVDNNGGESVTFSRKTF